jgi:hypothetical protein
VQTIEATPIHPLVAKAAKRWTDLAARHGVPATIDPMAPAPSYGAGGVFVRFDTGRDDMEGASIVIYPPSKPGGRPAQSAIHLTYRLVRGKLRFGVKPRITLRSMAFHIANFWNRPEVSA